MVGRHSGQREHIQPNVTTITKQWSLSDRARSVLARRMKYLPIPLVRFSMPPLASKSNMVIVTGPPVQVQQALQWAECAVLEQTPGRWGSDKTYIDLEDLSTSIRFLGVRQCNEGIPVKEREDHRPNTWSECVVQLEGVHDLKKPPSIHHNHQILTTFEIALEKLGSGVKVEMQGRLGRVVFSHRSSERGSLPYESSQPLESLVCDLTTKKVNKQRFDDSIDSLELSYLRAALSICRPKRTWRKNNITVVVSTLDTHLTGVASSRKFTVVESDTHPGNFSLKFVQSRQRLATADIVRLHVGAIKTDIRISMNVSIQHFISPLVSSLDILTICPAADHGGERNVRGGHRFRERDVQKRCIDIISS